MFKKQQKDPNFDVPKAKRFIVLPYVNKKAEDFAHRLQQEVTTNFPQVELNVVFKAPKTIGDMYPFKDNIKRNESKSLVVYKV